MELIVVDDGSTDHSAAIIKELAKNDYRIKYYFQKNAGVSAARNTGIEKSTGEFLFFLDADDCWKPENITNRLRLLNDEGDWVFGSVELINENGKSLNNTITGNDTAIIEDLLLWNGKVITTPSTITIKKKCVENLRFDTHFSTAADQDFTFYLAANFKGKYYDEPSVNYRVVNNSMSKNIALMEKDHIGVYKKAAKNKLFKNFWFKQKCFSNLYLILAGSWWKDGNNKWKALKYIVKSLYIYPSSLIKITNRIIRT